MPELPEVEHFRRLLKPLVNEEHPLTLELIKSKNPPKQGFISSDEIKQINNDCMYVTDVRRKGKQIYIVLQDRKNDKYQYLYVHMGMTGRITTPEREPNFGHFANNEAKAPDVYPPPYTYLRFRSGPNIDACFSDPRKFGNIYLSDSIDELQKLAHDGLNENFVIESAVSLSVGIKAALLDQKRIVCGVGNWVADEVLYQTQIHPDQNYLTEEQVLNIRSTLKDILATAVDCLDAGTNYPSHWIFHYRWSKGKNSSMKDATGKNIQFITSGGRTSAVVPTIQKLKKSQKPSKKSKKSSHTDKNSKPTGPKKQNENKDQSKKKTIKTTTKKLVLPPAVVSPEVTATATKRKLHQADSSFDASTPGALKQTSAKKRKGSSSSKGKDSSSEKSKKCTIGHRRSPRLAAAV